MNLNKDLLNDKYKTYLKRYWEQYPTDATFIGIHDYDHLLAPITSDSLKSIYDYRVKLKNELINHKANGNLDSETLLDLDLFMSHLNKEIYSYESYNRFERDPSIYMMVVIGGCLIFLLRNFAPLEQRLESLVKRLKLVPELLLSAKENLMKAESIPELWLKMGIDAARSAQKFFSQVVIELSGKSDLLRNDLMASGTLASKSCADYLRFIENELSQKPVGQFTCGEKYFEKLMREHHLLNYSIADLIDIGNKFIGKTIEEMKQVAAEIDGTKEWFEVLAEVKADTPTADGLLDFYRQEMDATREFTIAKDFVSLPEIESLKVIETPEIHRATYPYAGYMSPAAYEEDQTGYFWVTPIDQSLSAERQVEQLGGHSKAAITVRSLHEGYPGHHVQLCLSNLVKSDIRKNISSTVFIEGWALYCEDKFKELGFYKDKRVELIQLKDQLWRACRVVIDASLHTGGMTFDEAVDMLVETARLERINAVAEVKRYSTWPTQPMSYLIGKIQLDGLAQKYFEQNPKSSLKEFHDKLLSYGSIPFALIERSMLGTN